MKSNDYKVTINFVPLSREDIAEREKRIISILVKNAIKREKEKRGVIFFLTK